jgi:hypothetical protein
LVSAIFAKSRRKVGIKAASSTVSAASSIGRIRRSCITMLPSTNDVAVDDYCLDATADFTKDERWVTGSKPLTSTLNGAAPRAGADPLISPQSWRLAEDMSKRK